MLSLLLVEHCSPPLSVLHGEIICDRVAGMALKLCEQLIVSFGTIIWLSGQITGLEQAKDREL